MKYNIKYLTFFSETVNFIKIGVKCINYYIKVMLSETSYLYLRLLNGLNVLLVMRCSQPFLSLNDLFIYLYVPSFLQIFYFLNFQHQKYFHREQFLSTQFKYSSWSLLCLSLKELLICSKCSHLSFNLFVDTLR